MRRRTQRELQRRATIVCSWASHGLITRANAARVAHFEARGRDADESQLVAEIARAGGVYAQHLKRFRAMAPAAQQRLLATELPRMGARATPFDMEPWSAAVAALETAAEAVLSATEAGAIAPAALATKPSRVPAAADAESGQPAEASAAGSTASGRQQPPRGMLRRLFCAGGRSSGGRVAASDTPRTHTSSESGASSVSSTADGMRSLMAWLLRVRLTTVTAFAKILAAVLGCSRPPRSA